MMNIGHLMTNVVCSVYPTFQVRWVRSERFRAAPEKQNETTLLYMLDYSGNNLTKKRFSFERMESYYFNLSAFSEESAQSCSLNI